MAAKENIRHRIGICVGDGWQLHAPLNLCVCVQMHRQ